jgi:hypothetical protein
MEEEESYAVYLNAEEEALAILPGLRRAFDFVTDRLCTLHCDVEAKNGLRMMSFRERRTFAPFVITTDNTIPGDALRKLMRQSLDGRLKGFGAMPVSEFYKKKHKRKF